MTFDDLERGSRRLFEGTVPVFAGSDWEKPWKLLITWQSGLDSNQNASRIQILTFTAILTCSEARIGYFSLELILDFPKCWLFQCDYKAFGFLRWVECLLRNLLDVPPPRMWTTSQGDLNETMSFCFQRNCLKAALVGK